MKLAEPVPSQQFIKKQNKRACQMGNIEHNCQRRGLRKLYLIGISNVTYFDALENGRLGLLILETSLLNFFIKC